jgi:hypothetical protein
MFSAFIGVWIFKTGRILMFRFCFHHRVKAVCFVFGNKVPYPHQGKLGIPDSGKVSKVI